jgi:hypothetical protein
MVEPGKASLDSLAPARRAVLVLLANQNRSYSDIAALLSTDEGDIRSRAFDAADELLSSLPSAPDEPVRRLLVDYALGQQRVSERQQTRAMLAEDAGARDWLAALEGALGLGGTGAGPIAPEAPRQTPPADDEPPPTGDEPPPTSTAFLVSPAEVSMTARASAAAPAMTARPSGSRVYVILGTMAILLGIILLVIGTGRG